MQSFIDEPTQEGLNELRKAELMQVARLLEVPIRSSDRKGEIKDTMKQFFIKTDVWPALVPDDEEAASHDDGATISSASSVCSSSDKEMKKLEAQLKLKELELETRRVELEMKSLELKSKELDMRSGTAGTRSPKFDASKYAKLVPKFQENKVEEFFQHFEKVAVSLEWPKSVWPTLVQCSLVGKAQEVYASLSVEECADYERLKAAILRAYELVPEAHRQSFRNSRKREDQTFVDFVQQKRLHFERWLSSCGVNDFEKLKELTLLEEIKCCVRPELRQHLDDREVKDVRKAAVMLDEYVLTHKVVPKSTSGWKGNQSGAKKDSSSSPKVDRENGSSPQQQKSGLGPCFYCKKDGHRMSECLKLKKKKEKEGLGATREVSDALASVQLKSVPCVVDEHYKPFMSTGFVSLTASSERVPVRILRDTGASQSLLCADALHFSDESFVNSEVLVKGVEGGAVRVPLHSIELSCDLASGPVVVGVLPTLPVEGVTLLLGNDIAGEKVVPYPIKSATPVSDNSTEELVKEMPEVFSSCVVTRSMAREQNEDREYSLEDTFMCRLDEESKGNDDVVVGQMPVMSRRRLVELQSEDPDLVNLSKSMHEEDSDEPVMFYRKDGILMRKWRPPDAHCDEKWREVHQVVVPREYRKEILSVAHEAPLAGHLGVNKTEQKVLKYFFWPGLRKDVVAFCKSCHVCQLVGKPNQKIPPAPLRPVPAFEEPFSRIIVDCVGPLPKTKAGNQYLLTMMCASTRFPEAIPLRRITAQNVSKALVKFFTMVGLPKCVQSDQGSNFTSKVFRQVMEQLGVQCVNSSAYHPQSQGALERFHQTLKNMMRVYCCEVERDWDEGVPLLLFAVREAVQESLGFSPFELVFGHSVRGPLKILREKILADEESGLLDYVSHFRDRLTCARELAAGYMKEAQCKMKGLFDRKAKERSFEPGAKVLVLLPIHEDPLQARYSGPYVVDQKLSDVNYVILTPDRRKKRRLCHINMLKEYVDSSESVEEKPVASVGISSHVDDVDVSAESEGVLGVPEVKLNNSEALSRFSETLAHLPGNEREQLSALIHEHEHLFTDVPGRTSVVLHDVDVGDSPPVKQHPYRANPTKMKLLRKEIEYMLANDIIEPSAGEWSSPCVLVPKKDGTYRFCTDYRMLNSKTKSDSFPMPKIDDCIDHIGDAKYVSKHRLA